MNDFKKFIRFSRRPDEVHYVPYLVFSQLEDCEDNENIAVTDEIKNLNGELIACWQFDTACTGDIENVGTNNGNYIEQTTVRVYDGGDTDNVLVTSKINVLVTSKILSDFHQGSTVEVWEQNVSQERILEILEELEEVQRKLYS